MAPRLSLLRGVETLTGISALALADPNDPHGALVAYSLLESARGSADARTDARDARTDPPAHNAAHNAARRVATVCPREAVSVALCVDADSNTWQVEGDCAWPIRPHHALRNVFPPHSTVFAFYHNPSEHEPASPGTLAIFDCAMLDGADLRALDVLERVQHLHAHMHSHDAASALANSTSQWHFVGYEASVKQYLHTERDRLPGYRAVRFEDSGVLRFVDAAT